jgi:hypothetical protein
MITRPARQLRSPISQLLANLHLAQHYSSIRSVSRRTRVDSVSRETEPAHACARGGSDPSTQLEPGHTAMARQSILAELVRTSPLPRRLALALVTLHVLDRPASATDVAAYLQLGEDLRSASDRAVLALAHQGLIATTGKEAPCHLGRKRVLYAITPDGRAALHATRDYWNELFRHV